MNIRNSFRLIGHLGANPEVKTTRNNRSYCNFSICINKRYKDKDSGETKTISNWFYPTIWGKKAETFANIAKKGIQVAIDGELTSRQVVDDVSGKKYHIVDLTVDNFELLSSKRSNEAADSGYEPASLDSEEESPAPQSSTKSSAPVIQEDEDNEDSINFNLDDEDNSFDAALNDDDSDIPF